MYIIILKYIHSFQINFYKNSTTIIGNPIISIVIQIKTIIFLLFSKHYSIDFIFSSYLESLWSDLLKIIFISFVYG